MVTVREQDLLLRGLDAEIQDTQARLDHLVGMKATLCRTVSREQYVGRQTRRTLSPETRQRMSDAQKRRWLARQVAQV